MSVDDVMRLSRSTTPTTSSDRRRTVNHDSSGTAGRRQTGGLTRRSTTNGTVVPDAPIDLASVSPKLASSTPTADRDPDGDGEWADRHEERRLDVPTLAELVEPTTRN